MTAAAVRWVCLVRTFNFVFFAEIQKFQQIVKQFNEITDSIASEVEKEKMKVSNSV